DPARAAAIAAHVRSCPACDAAHRRLRVVDALLMTVRSPELRPDFTDHVMAAGRLMPAPAPLHNPVLPLAAFYLVTAWIVTGAAMAFLRPQFPLGAVAASLQRAAQAVAQSSH